jgi:hypothetical protein
MPPDGRDACFMVAVYGVNVDIDVRHRCSTLSCKTPELGDEVRWTMPPGAAVRNDGSAAAVRVSITCNGHDFTTTADGETIHRSPSVPAALHALDGAVRSGVALAAPGLVFVHAGSVAVDGRAIVLPGRSFAGKTSLVAALLGKGADYLSDEYAVLDANGGVHPYARRLSIREPAGRREVAAVELGGATADGPLPVAVVAALHYRPGATWAVHGTSAASGAEALISNAVAARTRPVEVLRAATAAARTATHLEGERGDAAAAADSLLSLLASI